MLFHVVFDILTAVVIMVTVILDVTPCSLVLVLPYFRGLYCLNIQGWTMEAIMILIQLKTLFLSLDMLSKNTNTERAAILSVLYWHEIYVSYAKEKW